MDFSLSSSLVGSAVSNPDKLALDLQFAADKTLTARKGPTPVFTRASTGRFVGSNGLIQSAAINAPRFDHDPVTGVCKGLLMEEARTNICLQSENFGTNWSGIGRTISLNSATAPDGSTTADKIVEGTNNGLHGAFQILSTVSGSTYIGSMYVKAAGRDFAVIYTGASPTNGRYVSIPADGTGTVLGLYNANPSTVTLQYVGNGWYRVTILIVASVVGTYLEIYSAITGTNVSYTGDGTSGILVWGAQVELGSFPTSYIPTTTASVVRSADVCSITGSAFSGFYNQSAGTLESKVMIANLIGNNRGIVQIDDNTNNSILRHVYGLSDGGFRTIIRANADVATTLSTTLGTASVIQKRALAYEGTSFASVTNGGAVTTITRTMPVGLSILRIGNLAEGPFYLSGHIAAIRYYKKRLPNAKLQTLTV